MSLFRKHPDLPIFLYFGERFLPTELRKALGRRRRFKYVLFSHGSVVKQSNSFRTAEAAYLKECEKYSPDKAGRFEIGKHSKHRNGHLVKDNP